MKVVEMCSALLSYEKESWHVQARDMQMEVSRLGGLGSSTAERQAGAT